MDFAFLDEKSIGPDGHVNRRSPALIGIEVGLNKTLTRMGEMAAGPAARSVRPGDAAKLIREIKYRGMRHGFLLEFYRGPGRAGDAKSVFDGVLDAARDVTGLHVLSVVAGCDDRPAMVSVFPRDWRQRLKLGAYPEIEADPGCSTDSDRTRLERFICRCGKGNALLQTELARQLKELSEPPHLKYGRGESFKSMTLRRQPGQPPLARISSGDDPPEELREIDRSLAVSLVREGLALDERGHLTIPSSEIEEFVARVLRAIRSTLGVGSVSTDSPHAEVESRLLDFLIEKAGSIEGPEDWSTEHDHYLYGTPKRNEGGRE
jgi:hypothetical protein